MKNNNKKRNYLICPIRIFSDNQDKIDFTGKTRLYLKFFANYNLKLLSKRKNKGFIHLSKYFNGLEKTQNIKYLGQTYF